jgi:hypothetical protein
MRTTRSAAFARLVRADLNPGVVKTHFFLPF